MGPRVNISLAGDLPPELYPLSWLVGTWKGEGVVSYAGIEQSAISQTLSFSHNGGPYLNYNAVTHLVDQSGSDGQVWSQESGFWRVTPGQNQPDPPFELEVFLADPAGVLTLYLGQVNGPRIDLGSDAMVRSASAAEMNAATRMYGLVEGDLLWAWDMAAFGHPLSSYLSARLNRCA